MALQLHNRLHSHIQLAPCHSNHPQDWEQIMLQMANPCCEGSALWSMDSAKLDDLSEEKNVVIIHLLIYTYSKS
jgi:hypothetical protein